MLLFIPDDVVGIHEKLDMYSSIAGGSPCFYNNQIAAPDCRHCHTQLSLLVQVYASLEQAHRSLYVFYCSSGACLSLGIAAKSFCCMDEEFNASPEESNATDVRLTTDSWGLDETDDDEDFDIQLQSLEKNSQVNHIGPVESNPIMASSSADMLCFHLAVVNEPDKLMHSYQHELELLKNYELQQETSVDSNRDEVFIPERYEQGSDPTFTKFQKRLSRDSRQCIRFGRGERPLFMKHHDNVPKTICTECGHEKIFEMQLMPNLIHLLRLDHDWGTISIFTCPNACTRQKLIDESVFIEDGF